MRRNQKHRKKARRGAARSSQDKFRNGQSEIQCILIRIVVDRKTFYSFFNELYGHSHSFIERFIDRYEDSSLVMYEFKRTTNIDVADGPYFDRTHPIRLVSLMVSENM